METRVGHFVVRVDGPGSGGSAGDGWESIMPGVWLHVVALPSVTRFESDDVLVVVSGILYQDIATGLGYRRQSQMLASMYLDGGLGRLASAVGMFSAVVCDKRDGRVFVFGDMNGGRRVFYAQRDDACYASSKLTVLRDLGISGGRPNMRCQEFAFIYGYHPGDQCVFDDVLRAPKSVLLELTGGRVQVIDRASVAAAAPGPEPFDLSERAVIGQLHDRLVRVTASALQGFENVAVMLGGFDSALTAALAKAAGKHVHAYTFQYDDTQFNQANVSSIIEALGIDHDWVRIGGSTMGDGLRRYADIFDRPTNWPNYVVQTLTLGQIAVADGAEVIVTGDGCDEIFLGYPGIYRGARFFSGEKQINQRLVAALQHLTRGPWKERRLGHIYRLVQRILANAQLPQRTRLYLMFRIMDESSVANLFGRDLDQVTRHVRQIVDEVAAGVPDYPATLLAYEGRDPIIPNRLKLVGTMDGAGVPTFSPYMHPDVRDFVRGLPEALLRPTGEAKRDTLGKDVLLKMADQYALLPHHVIYQPKHAAVDGPLDRWYQDDLAAQMMQLFSQAGPIADKKLARSLITEKGIEKFYRRHFSVDAITSHAASMLATYGSFFPPR
ncbi:MAG: asparagine synthase-related protein [Micrococcales bacterium]|nr:asparagine synthase-related protein [Micrococcales bacterium]